MSRMLYMLIRGTCCAALLACIVAVGLGRSAPRPASFLLFRPSRLGAVNGYHFGSGQRAPRFLDSGTGRFTRLEFSRDDFVDCATFADWEDDQGKSVVVARWVRRDSDAGLSEGYGLGRYRVPGGETIDRIPLDIMPMGHPCFVPGKRSAVVFSAGDGKLYHLDFEPGPPGSPAGDSAPAPVAIQWTKSAGKEPAFSNDPIWPTDKRLEGRMLVSVTVEREIEPGKRLRVGEIWWLQLNSDRNAVVTAGRLIQPSLPEPRTDGIDEVQPNVATTPEGGLTIGYLSRKVGVSGWNLTVAPIDFDLATGVPTVRREAAVQIADTRAHTLPIFSHDGRWVYTLPRRDPKPEHFERMALPESVLLAPSSRSHVAVRATRSAWN